jgi:hypothetical protein
MRTYGDLEEIFHASSDEVSLADTVTCEFQAPAALSRSDPEAQWNAVLKL